MIVNPGPPDAPAVFLGGDGRLYRVQGAEASGRYFLGADGVVYALCGSGEDAPAGRYFLGDDGTLYELRPG
jgi:hypothetical protein